MKRLLLFVCVLLCMLPILTNGQALDQGYINWHNPLLNGASCNSTTLNAAITAIGSAKQTMYFTKTDRSKINCTWTISVNTATNINTVVYIPAGVTISVNTGITLTFNGPVYVDDVESLTGVGNYIFNYKQFPGLSSFVSVGCIPAVPVSSLTLAAFTCTAGLQYGSHYFTTVQAGAAVGPLTSGNNTTWLLFDYSTTRPISGWTRQSGTHYMWQLAATRPSEPDGALIFARVTIASNIITKVDLTANRQSVRSSSTFGYHDIKEYGALCNGTTDDSYAMNYVASLPFDKTIVITGKCHAKSSFIVSRSRTTVKGIGTSAWLDFDMSGYNSVAALFFVNTLQNIEDVEVSGLKVTALFNTSGNSVIGVSLGSYILKNAVFDNLDVRNDPSQEGIIGLAVIQPNSQNIRVSNSRFLYGGIQCSACTRFMAYGNVIEESFDVALSNGDSGNGSGNRSKVTIMAMNMLTRTIGNPQGGSLGLGGNDGGIVALNHVENAYGSCYDLTDQGVPNSFGPTQLVFAGNIGYNCSENAANTAGGFIVASSATAIATGLNVMANNNGFGGSFTSFLPAEGASNFTSVGSVYVNNGEGLGSWTRAAGGLAVGSVAHDGVLVGNIGSDNYGSHATSLWQETGVNVSSQAENVVVASNLATGNRGGSTRDVICEAGALRCLLASNLSGLANSFYNLVRSISSTNTKANNLKGSVTFGAADSTKTVTFATAEADISYNLALSFITGTGSPDPDSKMVVNVIKATTGFDVTVVAVPGAGATVTYDWELIR